jgi:hypothetical protein
LFFRIKRQATSHLRKKESCAYDLFQGIDELVSGEFQNAVTIVPYTVTAYWITPYFEDRPADPTWIETRVEDSNVILRWRPNIWSRISIHMRFTRSRPAPRQGFEPNAAAVSDVG